MVKLSKIDKWVKCKMRNRILFVNACVRKESRTMKLAKKLLSIIDEPYEELRLGEMTFSVVNEEYLNRRDVLIAQSDFQDSMFDLARQFAEAETIVIAAPYWDLSFPAMLKQYLEQINVVGITFKYSKEGVPIGLCKADRLIYVSTAGGHFVPEEYGFRYIKALSQNYYGIQDVRKIEVSGLDIVGADVNAIMRDAEEDMLKRL